MNMDNEPVVLPAIVTQILAAIIAASIIYLTNGDWKSSVIAFLTALGGVITGSAVSRSNVVSNLTLRRNTGKTIDEMKPAA